MSIATCKSLDTEKHSMRKRAPSPVSVGMKCWHLRGEHGKRLPPLNACRKAPAAAKSTLRE